MKYLLQFILVGTAALALGSSAAGVERPGARDALQGAAPVPAPAPVDSAAPADTTPAAVSDTSTAAPDTSTAAPDTSTAAPDTTFLAAADTAIADRTRADTLSAFTVPDSVAPSGNEVHINSAGAVSPLQWFVMTARVDTSNADVRAIMRTWKSYMLARYNGEDGAWLWNTEERLRWDAFNLFANYVFDAPNFFGSRRATVLSVEKSGGMYCVRTMFDERSLDGTTSRIDPWAIVRVFFEKEDEQWWIRNAIGILTNDWMVSRVRFITFVYPKSHQFDLARAMRTVAFCDSIVEEFPFLSTPPIRLYITDDPEKVDQLLGLDYFAAGSHEAVALRGRGIIITSRATEWNPREMLHMLMGRGLAPHRVVSDGFVGWVGGWDGTSYRDNMRRVANYLAEHDSLEFDDLISRPMLIVTNPDLRYAPGAVLCEMAWARSDNAGILDLFNSGPSTEGLYRAIEQVFGIDGDDFQFMWKARVRELR